jgi:hypothetical protein
MNIETRLQKLEMQSGDSEFCACSGPEQKIEIQKRTIEYDAYQSGRYMPYQDSETAKQRRLESEAETPTIENCQTCCKPINKRLIILEYIK